MATKRKAFLAKAGLLLGSVVVSLLVAEALVRLAGHGPWNPALLKQDALVRQGKKLYGRHPTLGHIHLPGKFEISLSDEYSFRVTNLPDGLRATHLVDAYSSDAEREEIWVFGCSFTQGWSLNDDQTYAWLLQRELPVFEVVNFGTCGYGTLQCLIRFEEALETRKKPVCAILAYASFQDARNIASRRSQKGLVTKRGYVPIARPYASLSPDGSLTYSMEEAAYKEAPFMRYSAFVSLLESFYNKFEELFLYDSRDITKAIIGEFSSLAASHDVEFVLAGIKSNFLTRDLLEYAADRDILTADISVDLEVEGNRNLPHDGHPSPRANVVYAEKLLEALETKVLGGRTGDVAEDEGGI